MVVCDIGEFGLVPRAYTMSYFKDIEVHSILQVILYYISNHIEFRICCYDTTLARLHCVCRAAIYRLQCYIQTVLGSLFKGNQRNLVIIPVQNSKSSHSKSIHSMAMSECQQKQTHLNTLKF